MDHFSIGVRLILGMALPQCEHGYSCTLKPTGWWRVQSASRHIRRQERVTYAGVIVKRKKCADGGGDYNDPDLPPPPLRSPTCSRQATRTSTSSSTPSAGAPRRDTDARARQTEDRVQERAAARILLPLQDHTVQHVDDVQHTVRDLGQAGSS